MPRIGSHFYIFLSAMNRTQLSSFVFSILQKALVFFHVCLFVCFFLNSEMHGKDGGSKMASFLHHISSSVHAHVIEVILLKVLF